MPDLANHPGLHMPRAATSWASCLFAVDEFNMYQKFTNVKYQKYIFFIKTDNLMMRLSVF
ncbi:hypothetical protein DAE56_26705 [Salmonella enterica]|nr:hypothetical protein [Salmonella enterica]